MIDVFLHDDQMKIFVLLNGKVNNEYSDQLGTKSKMEQ